MHVFKALSSECSGWIGVGPVQLPETCRKAIARDDGTVDHVAMWRLREGDRFQR